MCLGGGSLSALDIVVSLERGTPAMLLFSLTGDGGSRQLLRAMNAQQHVFRIANVIQGSGMNKQKRKHRSSFIKRRRTLKAVVCVHDTCACVQG